jgi:AcrR family transcriptional regulator
MRFFAANDYAAADVQQLAAEIGVGKGTIYRYFASKEALFFAAVDHGLGMLEEAVDAAALQARTPLDSIGLAIRAYLEFFDAHPEVVELFIQERAHFRDRPKPTYFVHKETKDCRWGDLLQSLIDDRILRDIPAARVMDVVSQLVYGTMFTNYFQGRSKPLEAQCQDILDVVFHGILNPEGGQPL